MVKQLVIYVVKYLKKKFKTDKTASLLSVLPVNICWKNSKKNYQGDNKCANETNALLVCGSYTKILMRQLVFNSASM